MAEFFWKLALTVLVVANFAVAHHIPGHLTDDEEGLIHKEAVHEGPGILWSVSEDEQIAAAAENVRAAPESPVARIHEQQNHGTPLVEAPVQVLALRPDEKSADILVAQLSPNPVAETVLRIPGQQENLSPAVSESKETPEREEAAAVQEDKPDFVEDLEAVKEDNEKVEKEKCFFSFFGSQATTTSTTEAPSKGESVRAPESDIPQSPAEYGATKWTIPSRINFPATKARRRLAPLPRTQITTPLIGFPFGSSAFLPQSQILKQSVALPQKQQAFFVQPGLQYSGPVLAQQQAPMISQPSLLQPLLARPVALAPMGIQSGVYVLTPKDQVVTPGLHPTKKETEEVPAEKETKDEEKENEKEETEKPEEKEEEDKSEVPKEKEPEKEENVEEKEQRKEVKTAPKESAARWFFGGWGGYYEPEYYYDYYDYEYHHHHSPYSWYW